MKPNKPSPQKLQRLFEDVDEVSHLEAHVNYTLIYLKNGKKHLLSYTLKRFEEMLEKNNNFSRIHRRYIINNQYIRKTGLDSVILRSGVCLPVSRRRRVDV